MLHRPAVHTPPSPQTVPSVALVAVQPLAGSQASTVQGLPSSQAIFLPPQLPLAQKSALVQAELSSQAMGKAWVWQPLPGSHQSAVQLLPSSQLTAVPAQASWTQASA
jgi:hypothetical protein